MRGPSLTEYFVADHPFLYVIKKRFNILFYGRQMMLELFHCKMELCEK